MENEIEACSLCGGPVIAQGSMTGTRYYVSVAKEALDQVMDKIQADNFLRDRLQRAELIIENLKKELGQRGRKRGNGFSGQRQTENGDRI